MVGVFEPVGHLVGDRAGLVAGDILGQARDSQALLADHLSFVGLDLAPDQPQERALAFTVATQQADPLALLDLQLDLVEQTRASKGQTDVSQAQQCHECARTRGTGRVMDRADSR